MKKELEHDFTKISKKEHQLINDVLSLNKKPQLKKPTRTEPTLQISEFNLVKPSNGKKGVLYISDLTKVFKKRTKFAAIGKNVKNSLSKGEKISKPLDKPKADRIRRTVAYEGIKAQLGRWDAVVTSNRASNQLSFPLPSVKLESNNPVEFRIKSYLQRELEELEPKVEVFNLENEPQYPLTIQEMMEKRKEMAKVRAMQSYKEAKARRQSKIKSKKFHRVQRKEKLKQQMKEFEEMQKNDPEAALKKLEEIEKVRATERASLRHRSTGKWAKNKQIQAKYDKESRQVLAQQLSLSRELTTKLKAHDSESDDEPNAVVNPNKSNNPWINSNKNENEVEAFISGYKRFWESKNKQMDEINENANTEKTEIILNNKKENDTENKIDKKQSEILCSVPKVGTTTWEIDCIDESSEDETNGNESNDKIKNRKDDLKEIIKTKFESLQKELETKPVISKKRKQLNSQKSKKKSSLDIPIPAKRSIIDEQLLESYGNSDNSLNTLHKILEDSSSIIKTDELSKKSTNIDPDNIVKIHPVKLNTEIPDLIAVDTDEEEEVDQNEDMIEAFKDDDIVAEFKKDKQADIGNGKLKDVNLLLPGWGSWGGTGIKPSKRKQKRFIIKFPKKVKRRDDNKGSLIINEKGNAPVKPHLVSELPFPFKKTNDFEASVRAPISNTFVPEIAFRKMIQPAVVTKMGTIIEPMTDDILLKKKK